MRKALYPAILFVGLLIGVAPAGSQEEVFTPPPAFPDRTSSFLHFITITQFTPAQCRREAFDLMLINTQSLTQNFPFVGFLAKSSAVEDGLKCPPGVRCAEVTAEGANLRKSPSVGGRVLTRLPKGAIVSTFDIQGDWVQIERSEEPTGKVVSGWLHRSLVKQVQCFED